MIERCADRQRKLDGLEKWPFKLFIESLPVMLQIALLLLSCGLSRYVWSVNLSVARVVISFTVLGIVFYLVIVIAGASSYECPFQTPASTTLRALRSNKATQRLLASLSPLSVISFVYIAWRNGHQEFPSRYRRICDTVIDPLSWGILLSNISGIATNVGHQTLILLLHVDRAFGNAKYRLVQWVRRCKRAMLLPITHEDANNQLPAPQPRGGLLIPVRNIASLRKWNADNARCMCWIIRNITDPEAIDSAIRLAGTIHWFDGNVDVDPPFEFIVSTFEACFDSARKPYPGMSDRAYFSGRAMLRISKAAELRSQEFASKYPIPSHYHYSKAEDVNKDLSRVLSLSSHVSSFQKFDYSFLGSTPTRSMWMSNLHVDVARTGPAPHAHTTLSTTEDITPFGHATDANTILSRFIRLGGSVEEETFWADDKSYVVAPSLSLSAQLINLFQRLFGNDLLAPISEDCRRYQQSTGGLRPSLDPRIPAHRFTGMGKQTLVFDPNGLSVVFRYLQED
jgi:hypothetical protein